MKSKRKQLEQKLGSWAFKRLQSWAIRQSPEKAYRRGSALGRLMFRLSRKHRRIALSNLALAFPEMSESDRLALAVRVFEHFGQTAVDFMRASIRTNEEVLNNTRFEGLENVDRALEKGKGVMLITGHLGNWERGAHFMTAKGYKLSVIARDANQSDLNDLVLSLRQAAGLEVIARGNAARPVLTKMRQNELVAILPDQNSWEAFVPFFGKPAGTALGPAVLHRRTGATLIPLACFVDGPGKLHMVFGEPIVPLEGCEDEDCAIMAAINKALEDLIRVHPEQYLWFHDRWKSARRKGLL